MKHPIFFFVRVFENKEYAESFLKGNLYLNHLSYFKGIEDNDNRGDKYEAVESWLQPEKVEITLDGKKISGKDLAGPVCVQENKHNNSHIYCMYAAHSGEFEYISEENISAFREQIEIPEACFPLGSYAVVILQAQTFLDRVVCAIENNKFFGKAKLVRYYDPDTFHGSFGDEAPFMKQDKFSQQKEYRFYVDTGTKGYDPLDLYVGDLSDIARITTPEEINRLLEIKLPTSA